MIENMELKISNILKDLGISPALQGYTYLRKAIFLAMEDDTMLQNITGVLYPTIARIYHTDPTAVERCMRHAIWNGWNKGNQDLIDDIARLRSDLKRSQKEKERL